MYQPDLWVPRPQPVQVFHVMLDNLNDIRDLLGATDVRQAYNKNRTILIEWLLPHRDTFAALVGQYIVRNSQGEFEAIDPDELRRDYQPFVEEVDAEVISLSHEKAGRLMAVHEQDGVVTEVLFELPSGDPASFLLNVGGKDSKAPDEPKQERNSPTPGPPKNNQNQNKENN